MKIIHISDLHFHESDSGVSSKHRHSIACLKGIENLLNEAIPSHLVVSGDITNIGDKPSLERAYQWIHDRIYADGEYVGLQADERCLTASIVPGNHDAFNAPTSGSEYKRWQSSLENFYGVFHKYRWNDQSTGVQHLWYDVDGVAVFFCHVDSCYLGDPETEHLGNTISLSSVAKGRLSRRQSEAMLSLFDRGMSGQLQDQSGIIIPGNRFLGSLKVLVMHHYLFEPSNARAEPLLQLSQKREAFQNIAMSDFDVLLCGHKHIAETNVSNYADNFDRRGRVRLAFNYVRRILRLGSLPLSTEERRLPGKFFRFMVGLLVLSKGKGKPLDDKTTNEIINLLERALENPNVLKEELIKHLRVHDKDSGQSGLFDQAEINQLYAQIRERFNRDDRKTLAGAANRLKGLLAHLAGRPFAHVMCASSAKASETELRNRGVNYYEILRSPAGSPDGYVFRIVRYSWDATNHRFIRGQPLDINFPSSRGLHS